VAGHGAELVELLAPRPGERIVDLGCGTGTLTARIAAAGAEVTGIDADPEMVDRARRQHPGLRFTVGDGHGFMVTPAVDAVFSNAALHWMSRPEQVLAAVRRALRPGGRLVAELGAAGNCRTIIEAVAAARRECGAAPVPPPWFFPSPARYAAMLEGTGFTVRLLACFDRPTRLDAEGLAGWLRMFGAPLLAGLDPPGAAAVTERAGELARSTLYRDGDWFADYRRLRLVAERPPNGPAAGLAAGIG
jgi:trans-aconitate methyltransferase